MIPFTLCRLTIQSAAFIPKRNEWSELVHSRMSAGKAWLHTPRLCRGTRSRLSDSGSRALPWGMIPFIVFFLINLPAGADPIRGEFWLREDLMEIVSPGENIRKTGDLSQRQGNALKELLEDARWSFSGMIYGFSVIWIPSSNARAVKEELLIEPLALIPEGDPRMKTVSLTRENGFLYVLMEYTPDSTQESRLEGWGGEVYPASAGAGTSAVDFGSRRNAIKTAIKEALRAYLRVRDYNRPREVRGRVAFTDFPCTSLSYGSIKAVVKLRMDLEPLRAYAID
ncbi:MAG: hypothetical protein DRP70_11350 [Spirochaetes bacterium]|nr:MAG: hypothetical protein DRP70_11350 [Spirochaetota bacterium]